MRSIFKYIIPTPIEIGKRLKELILAIIMLCLSAISYAQQKGYKEIQIGSNIHDLMVKTNYRFGVSKTSKFEYYAEIDTGLICGMPVDHLKISVNDSNTVTEVYLYTKQETLPNYQAFSNRLKEVLFKIKDNLGTPIYSNLSKGEMHLLTVWEFKETNTMLSVRTDDVGTFAKDFQTAYLFIWQTDKNAERTNKMW